MSGIAISLHGAEKVIAALERAGTETERKTVQAVIASAFRIQGGARRDVAVDSGNLRSRIFVRFLDGGRSAEVGTDVLYGPFVERGTRFMPPRPYLIPAYEAERPKFIARLRAIVGAK